MIFKKRTGRLMEKAPDMYALLDKMCSYISEVEKVNSHFPDALSQYAEEGREIMRFIDEE